MDLWGDIKDGAEYLNDKRKAAGDAIRKRLGIGPVGPRPDAASYFAGSDATTAENLRRAYEAADKAGAYQTNGQIRDGVITARQTDAPLATAAHDPGAVERAFADQATAERVSAPTLGNAAQVSARSAGPTERAGTSAIGAAALQNRTGVERSTDASGAGDLLKSAAMGQAPSKAEALLDKGLDATSRKQLALAASAKGSERRGARRGAMLAIGEEGAREGQDKAALRADEMAKSRGELSQYAQSQQSLAQSANNLQGQIDAARARGDADSVNRLMSQQAELDQGAKQFDVGAANSRTEADTARGERADVTNAAATNARDSERAAAELAARTGNATRSTSISQSNAAATTAAALAAAAAANARTESLARRSDESDQQYAARVATWQEQNAVRNQQAQGATLAAGQAADVGNIGRQQTDQQIRQSGENAAMGTATSAAGQQQQVAIAKYGGDMAAYNAAVAKQEANRNFVRQTLAKVALNQATGGAPAPGGAASSAPPSTAAGDSLAPPGDWYTKSSAQTADTTADAPPVGDGSDPETDPAALMDAQAQRTRKAIAV